MAIDVGERAPEGETGPSARLSRFREVVEFVKAKNEQIAIGGANRMVNDLHSRLELGRIRPPSEKDVLNSASVRLLEDGSLEIQTTEALDSMGDSSRITKIVARRSPDGGRFALAEASQEETSDYGKSPVMTWELGSEDPKHVLPTSVVAGEVRWAHRRLTLNRGV